MKVLVSAATRHGSTDGIALRIAAVLRASLPGDSVVEVHPAADVDDVTSYDAVVLGSAVYLGRWLKDARRAVARIAAQPPRPVWLFSSGPIGDPPTPDTDPVQVSDLMRAANARGHHLFAGRLDRHQLGLPEKAVVTAIRIADGDFRDWPAVDAWGRQIAAELNHSAAA